MTSPYSLEDRAKTREAVRRMDDLSGKLRALQAIGKPMTADETAFLKELTETDDVARQIRQIEDLSEQIQHQHIEKLIPLAKDEFAAFCEVVNPTEPPESPWHIWLTNKLQEIEFNPDLNKFVLNVPPGHAKPLHVDTMVEMGSGRYKRLGDIQVGEFVIAQSGAARLVTAVHEQGVLKLVRIKTGRGREVLSAYDHPFLAERKGKRSFINAADLQPDDRLVMASGDRRDAPTASERDNDVAAMLGYMSFGAALTFQKSRPTATVKTSPDLRLSTSRKPAMKLAFDCAKRLGLKISVCEVSKQETYVARLGVVSYREMAEAGGDWFTYDPTLRCVPPCVFEMDDTRLARFLSAGLSIRAECIRRLTGQNLRITHRSVRLLEDLQRLCQRLGAASSLQRADPDFGGATYWSIDALGIKALQRAGVTFADHIMEALRAQPPRKQVGRYEVPTTDRVVSVTVAGKGQCRCLTVDEESTFTAENLVVHNSTYASRLFVAWRLGRDPDQRIIGGGHSQNFVENEFSAKIKDIVQSPIYQRIFPDCVLKQDAKAKAQWGIAGRRGQYVAKGVGQGIHGFRATFICVDDPYSKLEDAQSAVQRKKVETWFDKDIGSRALPGCKIFLIMTRFHGEDLTHHLEEQNKELPKSLRWTIITVPAICFDEDTDLLGRSLGQVLWPYYDLAYFQAKKIEFGFLGFSLTYQQNSAASSPDNISSGFQYYKQLPWLTDTALALAPLDSGGRPIPQEANFVRRTIVSVDTAAKTTQRADYTVVQVWKECNDGKHYLVHQERKKVEFNAMISLIEAPAIKYHADLLLVEDKGQGTAYIQNRQPDGQRRLAPCPVIAINPGTLAKEFRFDEVSPLIVAGDCLLPENAPWLDLYIQEFGQFPDVAHDDQVDATSQYLKYVKSHAKGRYGSRKIATRG
jgi:predicted phage terminase large subunit-like protein